MLNLFKTNKSLNNNQFKLNKVLTLVLIKMKIHFLMCLSNKTKATNN